MRLSILFIFHLLLVNVSIGQQSINKPDSLTLTQFQIRSLSTLGKLWGFLKYYHPNVASGKYDWDSVLIAKFNSFIEASNQAQINHSIISWLNELGNSDSCFNCENNIADSLKFNLDTSLLFDSQFDQAVIAKLKYLQYNRSFDSSYYVKYGDSHEIRVIHEKPYFSMAYPASKYRILCLFRYWNIVDYFSPYKYVTTTKWAKVLDEFIPGFYGAKNALAYDLSIVRLVTQLDDGHTALRWSKTIIDFFGVYGYVPFSCTILKNRAFVTNLLNDSLCHLEGITLGSEIISVDGESIAKRIGRFLPYAYSASNKEAKIKFLSETFLFRGKDSTSQIKFLEGGKAKSIAIKRYTTPASIFVSNRYEIRKRSWRLLNDNIGYVSMDLLMQNEVEELMDSLKNAKGIIFDLRQYPNDTWTAIAERLTNNPFEMARFSLPDIKYPGVFKFIVQRSPGGGNKDLYKGKVILIVNELTKSHAEFSAMGIQAAGKTISIGNTTAGSDGNIIDWIPLPGGMSTRFSGLGVYYPNGDLAQRIGVKIDIYTKPTIAGLQAGRDELLEKAIQIVNNEWY